MGLVVEIRWSFDTLRVSLGCFRSLFEYQLRSMTEELSYFL
jgi:hypothetical protein